MITKPILELYQLFDGSQYAFVGAATPEQLAINDGCDWDDIESYMQDAALVERGLAVPNMMEAVRAACDSEETFHYLKRLALGQGD
jgi:hypothetical protein